MDYRRAMDTALLTSVDAILDGHPAPDLAIETPRHDSASGARALDYGAYFDIVVAELGASTAPEVIAEAAHYLNRRGPTIRGTGTAAQSVSEAPSPRITTLSGEFYSPAEIDRFKRWWDTEAENFLDLTAVATSELLASRKNIAFVFNLLEQCSPELHQETLAVIREIVVAKPNGSQRMDFAGASSFALWGAVIINAQEHGEWPRHYQTLIHEAGHSLLFALAREEPLVLNDIEERVFSPLRRQERPLDGIYHAAFVSARESLAFDHLLCWHEDTGSLSAEEVDAVTELLDGSAIAFWDCAETLRQSAQLSPLGDAILCECEDYMRANFALAPSDPV